MHGCVATGFPTVELMFTNNSTIMVNTTKTDVTLHVGSGTPLVVLTNVHFANTTAVCLRGLASAVLGINSTLAGETGFEGGVIGDVDMTDSTIALTGALVIGAIGGLRLNSTNMAIARLFN